MHLLRHAVQSVTYKHFHFVASVCRCIRTNSFGCPGFVTQGAIRTSPVLSSNQSTIYLTSTDRNLYALDTQTRGLKWNITSHVTDPILHDPQVHLTHPQ